MCIKWERLRIDCQFIFIFRQKIWGVRYEEVNLVWIFHAVPKIVFAVTMEIQTVPRKSVHYYKVTSI